MDKTDIKFLTVFIVNHDTEPKRRKERKKASGSDA